MEESLYCSENTEGPIAEEDPVIILDNRVLINLISLQKTSMPTQNYFKFVQMDIQPYMRKIVTTWMLEVCEEQNCEDQVFSVAVNFLDRYLCTCNAQRNQLQLLGAVCLLLASKLRQCRALSVDLLAYYTDYSITPEEIKQWEVLIVSKLGWDLSPVTPGDFIDHLLVRIPGILSGNPLVRRHAATFVAISATEADFIQVEPAATAVAAIVVAVRGLYLDYSHEAVLSHLSSMLSLDISALRCLVRQIEGIVEKESSLLPPPSGSNQPHLTCKQQVSAGRDPFDGNETPTDVTDIDF